ncbi:MAG: hypothetical protein ABEI52_06410, partial [Halobacteriaceae archaeon]
SLEKAESNMFLLALTTEKSKVENVVDAKLDATKQVILHQQRKGTFPILGYSYYEYANSLKDEDGSSALLFSEYALETSHLDLYFPAQSESLELPGLPWKMIGIFMLGVLVGMIIIFGKPKKAR